MADSNYNRSFRRADGERPQQQRDERDRRERGGRGRGRDQDRDDRDWDRPRDRGNRYRDRDRDRDWDADRDRDRDRDRDHDRNRRYRSRSRDRRDRRRSRSRSPVRDDNRARRQRPEEPTAPSEAPNRALYYEESSPIQAAFPARDANLPPPAHDTHGPRVEDAGRADDHDSDHGAANTGLPTRPRVSDKQHASTAGPAATMSFRVGVDHAGHHGEEGRGRSRQRDDNSTAMDEDGEHAGQDRDHSEEGEADDDDEVVIEDDGTADAMQAMMGFSGFSSTKGKKVPGNNVGAVHKAKKTEYRQYMNRVGGFNRPLSPSR